MLVKAKSMFDLKGLQGKWIKSLLADFIQYATYLN